MNRKLFHASLAKAKAHLEEAQDMLDSDIESDAPDHVALTDMIEGLVTMLYDADAGE